LQLAKGTGAFYFAFMDDNDLEMGKCLRMALSVSLRNDDIGKDFYAPASQSLEEIA
jgi:hypothetical protein